MYISQTYCSKCKAVGVPLIKYCKKVTRTGTRQYYQCRPCVAERLKKYYHTENGKKVILRTARKYHSTAENKFKQKARIKVCEAIKRGELIKPKKCSVCSAVKPIQGHHHDYTKPLDVVWVCAGCHSDLEQRTLPK